MRATQILKEEHQGVKLALKILDRVSGLIAANPDTREEAYSADCDKLLGFFTVFVDKCHHAKEEELLFPALLAAGLPPKGGPVQVMLAEHADGRKLVADMYVALAGYRSGTHGAAAALAAAAQEYARLLAIHIDKEDNVLYPIADARISASVQERMVEGFEAIEIERIGEETHEQFHTMLKELKSAYLR